MLATEKTGETVIEIRNDAFTVGAAPDALAFAVLGDREHLALLEF